VLGAIGIDALGSGLGDERADAVEQAGQAQLEALPGAEVAPVGYGEGRLPMCG
jgi:hypothetical protein